MLPKSREHAKSLLMMVSVQVGSSDRKTVEALFNPSGGAGALMMVCEALRRFYRAWWAGGVVHTSGGNDVSPMWV